MVADDPGHGGGTPVDVELRAAGHQGLEGGNTEAISKRMYIVTVSAFVLWTVYGFVIGSLPIIVFNVLEPRA